MKFRSYIENAPDCIFIIDDHSHYLEVNSAVSTTLGYSSDEMLKLTLRDLIVEESLKDGRDHYKKLKESGQAVADLLIKHKNGSKVWLTINAVKLSSKLFLCFGKDITEQKQTEEALIASEEKFRSFIRFSSDPIFSFNRDGTYRFVNNIYASTLGKYPQEIIGKTRFDFFPPDEAESGMALVWKVFQTGEKGEREARIIIHTGEVRYFLTIVDPFKNELGEVLYVNCIAKDITALKKTELALRESEAQINALLAAVPDMIFVLDLQGVFLDYHGPLTAELYVSPEEFIGRNIQDILPPEIARQFEIAFKAAIQTGEIQVCTYSLPMPDGLNYYEAKVVTYAGSKFLTSIRNVTLHKKSEELIRQKNWDLEKINAEKDKFFSIIAHDLRSPFSGFLGLTETLVRRLPDMTLKEIQEITLLMRKSAVYLFRLLGNLLEWSRMQRGLITFAPKSFLMSPKIIQNINLIKELAQLKGIEIHFRNDEDLMIFADENMFDSIVRNLVSNAVKYTRKGGSITVSAHNGPDGTVEISIKDTGIGMNPLLLNQLFRLDIQSNRNGTGGEYSSGLGLIICKDFIEKHGGKLEIESAEGVGSTFRFSLPAVNCH